MDAAAEPGGTAAPALTRQQLVRVELLIMQTGVLALISALLAFRGFRVSVWPAVGIVAYLLPALRFWGVRPLVARSNRKHGWPRPLEMATLIQLHLLARMVLAVLLVTRAYEALQSALGTENGLNPTLLAVAVVAGACGTGVIAGWLALRGDRDAARRRLAHGQLHLGLLAVLGAAALVSHRAVTGDWGVQSGAGATMVTVFLVLAAFPDLDHQRTGS